MKLVTVSQMQAIEKEADAGGLTYDQMMENAGQGLADIILGLSTEDEQLEVIGLVGPGNNGGDTLVALSALAAEGWKARAYLVKRKRDDLVKRFLEAGGEVLSKENPFEQLAGAVETADVFLDGIFGTGIKLPLKKDVAEFLSEVNDVLDGLAEPPLILRWIAIRRGLRYGRGGRRSHRRRPDGHDGGREAGNVTTAGLRVRG
jgi:NAD(P)H-hydrate epimerase